MITNNITATCGTPAKNRSACATLSDNCDALVINRKHIDLSF
jgi:hypothetical protein